MNLSASYLTAQNSCSYSDNKFGKQYFILHKTYGQCDQTTWLCFQYLAIFSNENLHKSLQIVPKWAEIFAQNQINL